MKGTCAAQGNQRDISARATPACKAGRAERLSQVETLREDASLSMTSMPPLRAMAMTQFWLPKSSPHGNPILRFLAYLRTPSSRKRKQAFSQQRRSGQFRPPVDRLATPANGWFTGAREWVVKRQSRTTKTSTVNLITHTTSRTSRFSKRTRGRYQNKILIQPKPKKRN